MMMIVTDGFIWAWYREEKWSHKIGQSVKESLIKLITFMVRQQVHHERNQYITVRPEPVEGLNQSFLNQSGAPQH